MSIKSDKWIRKMANEQGMIEPFNDKQVSKGTISYGLSSYGYDIRVADNYKIFTNVNNKMRVAQEEIFGPVLTTLTFSTFEEGVFFTSSF